MDTRTHPLAPAAHQQTAALQGRDSNPDFIVRPSLPERQVTASTIEDAYVRFIFYCNPALPLASDTHDLREAFRTPPKSGGKAFNSFTIFELVRQFYAKEIKTWTELTIKLGVEPPDPSKDESTQKIAQYGVRLKKWLNSMHIKAFFEYLLDIPNDYWTLIPDDPDPTGPSVRDGVAIEDDMALRALLPRIRPKRGRKRPDDDDTLNTPVQRQKLSPNTGFEDSNHYNPGSAHPDSRSFAGLPTAESTQTPLTRWPQSAITPTTKNGFWGEAQEPLSAVSPSKPKLPGQRRGAKNVSSAWKTGGLDSGTKTRGRPPMNRTPVEPSLYFPGSTYDKDPTPPPSMRPATASNGPDSTSQSATDSPSYHAPTAPSPASNSGQTQRPARPSISLQVPERSGGSVRLATPPAPSLTVNGQPRERQQQETAAPSEPGTTGWRRWAKEAANTATYEPANTAPNSASPAPGAANVPEYYFEKMEDRTNVDSVLAMFTQATRDSDWVDANGQPTDRPSVEECTALVNSALENMLRTATSPQIFLINLAALAGARVLMTSRARYVRLGEDEGRQNTRYRFEWEYRFGHVKGNFTMTQSVPRSMWHAKTEKGEGEGEEGEDEKSSLTAAEWQRKYEALLAEMRRRDKELMELRNKVVGR